MALGTVEGKRRVAGAPGRNGARKHPRARSRTTVPKNYWQRDASPLRHVGEEEFRLWALRGGKEHVLLGGAATTGRPGAQVEQWGGSVTEITWDDVSAILTGQVTLQREPYNEHPLDVYDGDEMRLEYRAVEGGKWQELWTMRCTDPQYDFAAGTIVFALENDLQGLAESVDDFNYQKTKKKPNGWLVHEAMADVCSRYGLKYKLVRTTHRIKKQGVGRAVSPWDFLKKLMSYEVNATGRKLMLRYHKSTGLTMTPLVRSPHMLLLGPTLIAAALQKQRYERFSTAVTLRSPGWTEAGTDAKGSKKRAPKKVFVRYANPAAVARYGYIHRILYSPDADSTGALMQEAKQFIVESLKAQRTLTITHPGIPSLKRGHSIQIDLADEGFKQIVYAKELHFRVGGGEFFMDVVCVLEDPYVDQRGEIILTKLTDNPAARGRKSEKAKKTKKKTTSTADVKPAPVPATPKLTPAQILERKFGGP